MNKKAQEEMVGFVLIMLIVAIIFLVFLGLYLRGASQESTKDSKDVSAFLEAVSKTTTNCESAGGVYYTVTELTAGILTGLTCSGSADVEDELRATLTEATNATWNFNPDSPTKGYILQVLQETVGGEEDRLDPPISQGQVHTGRIYASGEYPLPGGIRIRLNIYA